MNRELARTLLRQTALFRNLNPDILSELAAIAGNAQRRRGERLFLKGDPGDALYVVISGQIRIGADSRSGQSLFLNLMNPGDVIGEIALLDGAPRTAGAEVVRDSQLLVITRAAFLEVLAKRPDLARHLIGLLCQRIRHQGDLIEEAAFYSVPERIARRLLSIARAQAGSAAEPQTVRIAQSELAQFLNLSRQVVNQQLQTWRREHLIDLGRGRIEILHTEGLRQAAGYD